MKAPFNENNVSHNGLHEKDGVIIGKEQLRKEAVNDEYFSLEQQVKFLQDKIAQLEQENQKHQETSFKDELTGLPNNRYFKEKLKEFQEVFKRHTVSGDSKSYSILAFDLDGFKAINDGNGHAAGNECLRLVADEIKKVLRSSDFFAREGGDEFLILLPDVSEDGARRVGEKVLTAIEEGVSLRLQELLGKDNVTISASIGIVSYGDKTDEKDVDQKDMVEIADYLRYVVKALGKKAVLTLKEAKEYDVDGALWKKFMEKK